MQNQAINTGEINVDGQRLRIVANGMYTVVDDTRNQVITIHVRQVKLDDIAVMEKGYMDPPGAIMRVNDRHTIGIGIPTDPQRDVVLMDKMVDQELAELLPLISVGPNLEGPYLENAVAREMNNGLIVNSIEPILIVIVIIMLAIGMRAGAPVSSSLALFIRGTLLIMSPMDIELNRTSPAGFIIAIGMLVDNATMVTDDAQIAIARGVDRRRILIDGATGPQ